ncbi:MAG: hypothetical protein ACKVT2_16215 [Saprospiraceae bacterium]
MDTAQMLTVAIAGFVSLLVSIGTYFGLLRNLKESQFEEIIKERVKAYSNLWGILIKYGNKNFYHKLEYDKNWVIQYHDELDECNMKFGVLFSKDVHRYFEKLRGGLQKIRHQLQESPDYEKSDKFQTNCEELYRFVDDKENKRKGLGGLLKRGLGSFRKPIIE